MTRKPKSRRSAREILSLGFEFRLARKILLGFGKQTLDLKSSIQT